MSKEQPFANANAEHRHRVQTYLQLAKAHRQRARYEVLRRWEARCEHLSQHPEAVLTKAELNILEANMERLVNPLSKPSDQKGPGDYDPKAFDAWLADKTLLPVPRRLGRVDG